MFILQHSREKVFIIYLRKYLDTHIFFVFSPAPLYAAAVSSWVLRLARYFPANILHYFKHKKPHFHFLPGGGGWEHLHFILAATHRIWWQQQQRRQETGRYCKIWTQKSEAVGFQAPTNVACMPKIQNSPSLFHVSCKYEFCNGNEQIWTLPGSAAP